MKKLFLLTILSALFSLGISAQTTLDIGNNTNCAMYIYVWEVNPTNCSTVQVHAIFVAGNSQTAVVAAAAGNEFNEAVLTFDENNCMELGISSYNNGCMACPSYNFPYKIHDFEVECKNGCTGNLFNIDWNYDCSGSTITIND